MKRISYVFVTVVLLGSFAFSQDNVRLFKNYVSEGAFEEAYRLLPTLVKDKYKDDMLYVAFGDVYFEFEKYDSARIMYEFAYNINDEKPEIIRKYARACSYTNQTSRAVKLLKDYLKDKPDDWESTLELGYVYLRADSLRQAEYYITKTKELNKKSPIPLVALGDLYFNQKVYELARWNFEEALSMNPDLTDARIKLATVYYYLANREMDENLSNELFTRSLKEWQIVSQKDPKNAKAWYEQGKILFLARRFDDAARAFYQYIQLRPSGHLGRWYLAQSLVEIGKCDSAVQHLEIVSKEIDSVKTKAKLKLARCYFDNKDFSKSVDVYKELQNQNIFEAKDYERFASAYLKINDTTSALGIYGELLDRDPKLCQLSYQVGILAFISKNYPQAINFFNRYLANCNDSLFPKVTFYLGNVYFNENKPDSAFYYFSKSLERDSTNPLIYIYLGDALSALNDKNSARQNFVRAIELIENNKETNGKFTTTAFGKLSSLLLDLKDFKELNKFAKKWTEMEKESPFAWIYLAVSYQGMNNKDEACKAWKKVLQLDPKNKTANQYFKQLQCE